MNKIGNIVLEDEIMFRNLYKWLFGKQEGWFKIMMPILIILIYINIETDGLNCKWKNWFQFGCKDTGETVKLIKNDIVGRCESNSQCEEICFMWSKINNHAIDVIAEDGGCKDESGNCLEYTCTSNLCTCDYTGRKYSDNCSVNDCPWI